MRLHHLTTALLATALLQCCATPPSPRAFGVQPVAEFRLTFES